MSTATMAAIPRSRALPGRPALTKIIPVLVILAVWTAVALAFSGLRVIPTPWAVVAAIIDDANILPVHVFASVRSAAVGYALGNIAAIVTAVLFVQVPLIERTLMRIAVASFCIPQVAIVPILVVVLPGDAPKQTMAGLAVFFTSLIAVLLGLRSADDNTTEVIRSLGGSSWSALVKVRLIAMLPSVFAGLKIAAPAALLGAIIGEYMGSSQGLGVLLVQAQSSFQVPRAWGIALVMSLLAGLMYAVVGVIGRLATPWATHQVSISVGSAEPRTSTGPLRAIGSALLGMILSVTVVVAGWYALLRGFDLSPYFAKSPLDVIDYLILDSEAVENRTTLTAGLAITLADAGIGLVVGLIAAALLAALMVASSAVERMVLPLAVVLRSIPLVALTPLLALIFGRGLLGVTVIVATVTFFPTLVNVAQGLRSTPVLALDVVRSLGGGNLAMIMKVRLQYAIPSFFASARIAMPAALSGAMLAEWLATGRGLGSDLVRDFAASRFGSLWASSVTVVIVSMLLYGIVGAIERAVATRLTLPMG